MSQEKRRRGDAVMLAVVGVTPLFRAEEERSENFV
jgi:hypothetical protein